MSLTSGTRLGHYEIVSALGAGGMGEVPYPLTKSAFNERHGEFSPDGKWIAYASNESGRFETFVQSFPLGSGKWQVSTAGGMQPRWRRDGKEIFYVAAGGKLMAAAVRAGTTFEVQTPVGLFQTRLNGARSLPGVSHQYDVSADGQRFLVSTPLGEPSVPPINVVLNWTAALKK